LLLRGVGYVAGEGSAVGADPASGWMGFRLAGHPEGGRMAVVVVVKQAEGGGVIECLADIQAHAHATCHKKMSIYMHGFRRIACVYAHDGAGEGERP
jgi:hypothetical protein